MMLKVLVAVLAQLHVARGQGVLTCQSDEECDLAAGEYCNLEMMSAYPIRRQAAARAASPAHQTMNATLRRAVLQQEMMECVSDSTAGGGRRRLLRIRR